MPASCSGWPPPTTRSARPWSRRRGRRSLSHQRLDIARRGRGTSFVAVASFRAWKRLGATTSIRSRRYCRGPGRRSATALRLRRTPYQASRPECRSPHDHLAASTSAWAAADSGIRCRATGYPAPERTPHDHLAFPPRPTVNWIIRCRHGHPALSAHPMSHLAASPPQHAPPGQSPGAAAQRGEPADRAAAMRTLPLPAGACPIGRFENPLPRNGHLTLNARPMITWPPSTTHGPAPIRESVCCARVSGPRAHVR